MDEDPKGSRGRKEGDEDGRGGKGAKSLTCEDLSQSAEAQPVAEISGDALHGPVKADSCVLLVLEAGGRDGQKGKASVSRPKETMTAPTRSTLYQQP